MATYFHGNQEIQGDGLQTLILMNTGGYNNVGYSDHPPPPNFSFLNSSSGGGGGTNNNSLDAPTTSAQQFVGIPLPIASHAPPSVDASSSAHHGQIPRFPYHVYGSMEQRTPPPQLRDVNRSQQGLSLTLSSQQVGGISRPSVLSPTSGGGSPSSASGVSNGGGGGGNGVQSVLLGSKYLKATQELLEETVNVGKGIRTGKGVGVSGVVGGGGGGGGEVGGGETSGKSNADLTTAERQEIQMKKAKLVHMLDEVEQRYRQYDHQMQLVISWFEQVAGIGSARTYTSLALQTISKQFRCLKDTILTQIKAASKSLGEEEGENEGSRLKFVDHQLRQQKALQQLGMIQPNAWRPQRGLPERSVSVLRAWLFEHFLHPYPKDSDKQILAKQTGLTRSQVSNWFINARVRLWKPMVEEMYLEEVKEHENTGLGEKKTNKDDDNNNKSNTIQERTAQTKNQDNNNLLLIHNNGNNSPTGLSMRNPPVFSLVDPSEMEVSIQSPKKQRSNNNNINNEIIMASSNKGAIGEEETMNDQFSIKFDTDQRQQNNNRERFSLLGSPTNLMGGFGSYPMGEIGRFTTDQFAGAYPANNNGVSLTLGLPHVENLSMSGTHHHQSYLHNHNNMQIGRRVDLGDESEYGGLNSPSSSHTQVVYETVNLQNRKRFAAQLMHDFVA